MTAADAFSTAALYAAALRAARGKRRRAAVARVLVDLEPRLVALRDALLAGAWRPGPPRVLHVRDPKPRTISVAPFSDRIVHQALAAVMAPRIERRLVRDTYACRPGLGTHAALARARAWARTYRYFCHLDVARFFPSIDHGVVLGQLAADGAEPWLVGIARVVLAHATCDRMRRHFPGDDLLAPLAHTVGLPLGNLTSQLWANRYLDPVDHLVKDRLRVRGYLRYMDDMLVFGDGRAAVVAIATAIEDACQVLRLRLHPWHVAPTRAGVGIVGYRVTGGEVRVRRTTVARAERRLARLAEDRADELTDSLRATFAHWAHANTWRLRERTLARLGLLYPGGVPDSTA